MSIKCFLSVEWIETVGALGAAKIILFKRLVHPNISKVGSPYSLEVSSKVSPQVFDHYSKTGLVDIREITFPEYQPNIPGLQHLYFEQRRLMPKLIQFELIPLNDCLYRNIYRSAKV